MPTLDLAEIDRQILEIRKTIAKSIDDACRSYRFFYIENHK